MRPPNLLLATIVLAGMACTSFQSTTAAPTPGDELRVEAHGAPLNLALRASDGRPTFQYCSARLVQGHVSMVIGDTLIFSQLSRVDPTMPFDRLCHTDGAARLVVPDRTAAAFSTSQADARRTIGASLLFGAAVMMIVVGM